MWISDLFYNTPSVVHAVFVTSIAAAIGLALGTINIQGVSLGMSGCLFAGILLDYLGMTLDPAVLAFLRDFGLILFVYAVGIQVGPSFMSALRSHGLVLNLLAFAVVVVGALLSFAFWFWGVVPAETAVGIFAGGSGNMPALGAAQAILTTIHGGESPIVKAPSVSCAVTYPFGVLGVIFLTMILKVFFHADPAKEAERDLQTRKPKGEILETMNIEITNENFNGLPLEEMLASAESGLVVSRIRKANGTLHIARPEIIIETGDVILAIGTQSKLVHLMRAVGRRSNVDIKQLSGAHASRRFVVTLKRMAGKRMNELQFIKRNDAVVTRIARGDVEFAPTTNIRLQYGDIVNVVGSDEAFLAAERELGNSLRALSHPQMIPIFIGIAIGLFFGSLPIMIPGLPVPVKLGLAGGPLVIAILLSILGHLGPVVWYLPTSSNLVLREMGIILFLTCVGLGSGRAFFEALTSGVGVEWLLWGAILTIVPILVVALVARLVLKMNFLVICGLLSGSTTNPPALSYSNSIAHSDAPSLSYSTVYPLAMILRVFFAQALVLAMSG